MVFCAATFLATSLAQTVGTIAWNRVSNTPILAPMGTSWESAGTFNPAVVLKVGKFVMLYRAQDSNGTSRFGYAESIDGIDFTRAAKPVLQPETDYEKDGGVEDPRLVRIGETYYLTYTGYNKTDAQLCLATSTDLIRWERKGVILPAYQGNWNKAWTKSGAILTTKIREKYWMYWLGTAADMTDQMGLSYDILWNAISIILYRDFNFLIQLRGTNLNCRTICAWLCLALFAHSIKSIIAEIENYPTKILGHDVY